MENRQDGCHERIGKDLAMGLAFVEIARASTVSNSRQHTLNMRPRAFAAGGSLCTQRERGFDTFLDLMSSLASVSFSFRHHGCSDILPCSSTHVRDSRARQKEDDQKHKWKIPRVIGMRNSGGRSGSDTCWRQRLLAPRPVHKGRNRRHGNDGLHDATRLRFFVRRGRFSVC